MSVIPPSLFKYTSADVAVRILKTNKVRFTPPDQFNDPFEQNPAHEFSSKGMQKIVEERIKYESAFLPPGAPSYHQYRKKVFPDRMLFAEKRAAELRVDVKLPLLYQEEFSKKFGVFCLSGRNSSLLMWAHYAKEHQGCVIVLSLAGSKFAAKWRLDKVDYQEARPRSDFGDRSFDFIYRKGLDWVYEEEWRMVASFEDLEKVGNGDTAVFLEALPPGSIRGVYLGARMTVENIWLVKAAYEAAGCPTGGLFKAEPDPQNYALNFTPVPLY